MKKAGIIGGIGPASTLDYYSGILNGYRAKTHDDNYPEIVINSINMTEMLSYVSRKNWDALVAMLLKAVKNLANAGADFAAIASNTPHIVFDKLQQHSPLPLISIVDATCRYARSNKCQKIVVIGTGFTMSSGLYSEALQKHNIAAIVPSAEEQSIIHNIIFPKLEEGIVVPEDKQRMLGIVNRLISEHHADALVLGCTELPLMIKEGDVSALILNTTQIHVEAIVNSI
ncbi:MAG: amino acid racemase [Peptococcaceae bacterium]|nr:amino acid racemase [Peptococcaceae bacterium]